VVKYIKERMAARLDKISESSDMIVLALTTNSLDPTVYDEPLTIRSEVPAGWTKVKVTQGSVETIVTPVNEGGTMVICYDAAPNGDFILLRNAWYISPLISYITPSRAKVSTTGFYMTVYGKNFTPTSIVRMGEMQRRTTYISSTRLRAWVMPSDLSRPRVWTITVRDSGQGGAISNGVTFTVAQ
jgi:hypothetical protein